MFQHLQRGVKSGLNESFFKTIICLPSRDNRIHFRIRSITHYRQCHQCHQCHQCCDFAPIAMDAHMRAKFHGYTFITAPLPVIHFPVVVDLSLCDPCTSVRFLAQSILRTKILTANYGQCHHYYYYSSRMCIFEQLKFIQNMCISGQRMSCGRCCYANVKSFELILISFFLRCFFQPMISI